MNWGIMNFGSLRRVIMRGGLGLGVFVLIGWPSAWAQQTPAAAVPVQEVAAPQKTTTPTESAEAPAGQASGYTVSPEDLLDVFVMDVPEVSRTYRVASDGNLSLPLLSEPIPAAGLSLEQLSRLIATRFHDAGMVSNAHVTISLKETRLHTVNVSGEVRHPQVYPVFGPTRLLDILTQAGGLADDASGDALITRGQIGVRADAAAGSLPGGATVAADDQTYTLNIRKLIESGDDKANILLYSGDRVTIKKAEMIYILGAGGRPGAYVPRDPSSQLSVLRALALAGDVTSVAKKDKISILRKDALAPDAAPKSIPVNIKSMLSGQVADLKLQPNDILFVPESGKAKFMRGASASAFSIAAQAGTSLLIYHY